MYLIALLATLASLGRAGGGRLVLASIAEDLADIWASLEPLPDDASPEAVAEALPEGVVARLVARLPDLLQAFGRGADPRPYVAAIAPGDEHLAVGIELLLGMLGLGAAIDRGVSDGELARLAAAVPGLGLTRDRLHIVYESGASAGLAELLRQQSLDDDPRAGRQTDGLQSLASMLEADTDARDPQPVPHAVRLADACELFDGDPGGLRCVLAAILQANGVEPGVVFEDLADVDFSPLYACEDDEVLIARVDELRAENGL